MLHGIDTLLAEELKVPVLIAENPMDCVAIGTGIMLDNIDKLSFQLVMVIQKTRKKYG